MNPAEQFRDALRTAGLNPPDVIHDDGKLHRFAPNGKKYDDSAWYVLHGDGIPAGAFGDWRQDLSQTWRADIGRQLTPAEDAAHRERIKAAQAQREAEEAKRRAAAATKAAVLWKAARPAGGDHPYLQRKGVAPAVTLRELDAERTAAILGYAPQARGEALTGRLLVAPVKIGDALSTCEMIDDAGRKSAIAGGAKRAGYWAAQPLPDDVGSSTTLLIGEGVATVLSAAAATGHPAVAALSCGNLVHVAQAMRERYPQARIVILADIGNGEASAAEAARTCGGYLARPDFGNARELEQTDFNDLHQARGAEAVKRAIDDAIVACVSTQRAERDDAAAGQEWPLPQALPDGLARVDMFDLEMVPLRLRAWVGDISERVQCPPDFVAIPVVAALGAVLGRKLAVRPQARTDWSEVANQWGLIIGRPGVLKSPAIEQALAPLRRLEVTARERFAEEESTYRAAALARKLRHKANERDAEKALAKNRNADVSQYLRDDDDDAPPMCRRYSTSDTTAESLAELMRQNQNGLLVHRDEMVSLLRDLDREERAGARGFFLTSWNGNSGYTVDRIGRGFDLHIPAVCLSLLGSTQPARIAEYVHAATHGGRSDDGLIQRFGLMVWPDIAGEWRNVDRWPDSSAKNAAFEVFVALDGLDPATVGAERDTGIDGEPEGLPYLRFDGPALGLFVEWRTELERRLRGDELPPALVAHLNKYRKLVPSLALVFHLADGGSGPIVQPALLRALAFAAYLESHARRVYTSGPASEAATARAILARIRNGHLPAVFAGWQVWRPGWAGLADRAGVADGLALLVDYGYLVSERVETTGRTATRYTVNPRALQ